MDDAMRREIRALLEAKLSPSGITANLLQAAMFLVAYELLKGAIVDNTKGFFSTGFVNGEWKTSSAYNADVLQLAPGAVFRASCLWLARMGAFTGADVDMALAIREHRHVVAHELPRIIVDPHVALDAQLFAEANRLISVLGRFWGRIDVDTNPAFEGQEIRDEEIVSGTMMVMQMILSILPASQSDDPAH